MAVWSFETAFFDDAAVFSPRGDEGFGAADVNGEIHILIIALIFGGTNKVLSKNYLI